MVIIIFRLYVLNMSYNPDFVSIFTYTWWC